jgi:hypothetical protein
MVPLLAIEYPIGNGSCMAANEAWKDRRIRIRGNERIVSGPYERRNLCEDIYFKQSYKYSEFRRQKSECFENRPDLF